MNNIKYLFLDVDGTLTDGKIYMGQNGEVMKAFDIKDGYGIHDILPTLGIIPVIITGRQSSIVERRCKELGISQLFQGVHDKLERIKSFLKENHVSQENVAFMGDDLNDLACLQFIHDGNGIVACPGDAIISVKNMCDYVCSAFGGNSAVREFIDNYLSFYQK